MADRFDLALRRLATALVDEAPAAPAVPPFPPFPPVPLAVTPVEPSPPSPTCPSWNPRRVLVGAVAIAVVLALGLLAVVLFDDASTPQSHVSPASTTPSTVASVAPTPLDGEWRQLSTTFTGWTLKSSSPFAIDDDTLLTIDTSSDGNGVTGEIYRFSDDTVRAIAPSNLEWRANAAVVWTGTEVIVAGGSNGPGIEHAAAAYHPSTDTWRELPAPPGFVLDTSENQLSGPAVWTGRELLAWQSAHDAVAFDPVTNRWRTLPPAPLGARHQEAIVATPSGVFVWGGCDITTSVGIQCDDFGPNGMQLTDGAFFDYETERWSPLPASPLAAGNHPSAVWTGEEAVVLVNQPPTDGVQAAAYNPATKDWRTIPNPPHVGDKYAVSVWTGEYVLTHSPNGGIVTALDPRTNSWSMLPPGPDRDRHSAVWAGGQLVITGGYPDATPWAYRFGVQPSAMPRRTLPASCTVQTPDEEGCTRRPRAAARQLGFGIEVPRDLPVGWRPERREIRMYPAGSGFSGASYAVAEFAQSWRTADPLPAPNPGPYGTMRLTARAADPRNPSTRTCEPVVVVLPDGVRACGSIRFVEDGTGSGRPLNVADVRWTVDGTEYRFSSVGPMNDEVLKVLKSLRAVH